LGCNAITFLKNGKMVIKIRVMLTCVLRAHVKVLKNRNLAFNDTKNLMLRELNTPQVQ
jgi:hypothetical protein